MSDAKENVLENKADKKSAKQSTITAKKAGTLIYVGASIVDAGEAGAATFAVKFGTIFANGLPRDVAARVDTDAAFAKLFVPLKDFAAALRDLKDENSVISSMRKQVMKKYSAKKGN